MICTLILQEAGSFSRIEDPLIIAVEVDELEGCD